MAPGLAVSYQSFGAASVLGGNTPRGPRGAEAHGYPGPPIGRPLGAWLNCRPCAQCLPPKFIGGSSQTAMGATLALAPRPPVLGGFPAAMPRFAPSCVGADCGDSLPGVDPPPGFWVVLQKNGPEFDVIPGFWAVVSVPRRDSRRWLRYNPRSEAFTSSMSRSAAYETAQNCTRALGRVANSPSVELPTKPPRTLLGHFGSRIGLSVELPTKPLRTLLGRSAAERWMNIVEPTTLPRTLLGRCCEIL